MNNYVVMGNLTRDPEQVSFANSSVTKFAIAVNGRVIKREGEVQKDESGRPLREVVYWDCEAWAQLGDMINQYAKKGTKVILQGEIKEESWEDKATGQRRSKKVVRVDKFNFADGKSDSSEDSEKREKPASKKSKKTKAEVTGDTLEVGAGEEIPF